MSDLFGTPEPRKPRKAPPGRQAPAAARSNAYARPAPPRPAVALPSSPPEPKVRPPRDARMKPNPGYCPADAAGKRVIVELNNGETRGTESVSTTTPLGWAADGPNRCRWSRTSDPFNPFDIAFYRVL
jgi:hypothetical protein